MSNLVGLSSLRSVGHFTSIPASGSGASKRGCSSSLRSPVCLYDFSVQKADVFLAPQIAIAAKRFKIDMVQLIRIQLRVPEYGWTTQKLVDILPSAFVLFILRKLPPKRGITQYHPIR